MRAVPRSVVRVIAASVVGATFTASSARLMPAQAVVRSTAEHQSGQIIGVIVSPAVGQPIAGASVVVRGGPSAGRVPGADTAFAAAASARANGAFRVVGLRPGRYSVQVRAFGFAPRVRDGVSVVADSTADIGPITVGAALTHLTEVQITEDRNATTLGLDRNSYSAKDMPASAGGTAIDLLRSVPAVTVDGDNNVSLRGDVNVIVQLNGRPTPFRGQQLGTYLSQLQASRVERIEVATNPSAKDEPDGAAGIINIVVAREAGVGTSGGVSAAAGSTGLVNVAGNIARQDGPWTGFASYGFFRDERAVTGTANRVGASDQISTILDASITGLSRPVSHNATVRGQYRLTVRDVLAVDADVNAGVYTRTSDAFFSSVDASDTRTGQFAQLTDVRIGNTTGDYALSWQHVVDAASNKLSVELRFNDTRNSFRNRFANEPLLANATPDPTVSLRPSVETTNRHTPAWRLQADWMRKVGGAFKVEAGMLAMLRRTTNLFDAATFVVDSVGSLSHTDGLVHDAARGNAFGYRDQVTAAYFVISHHTERIDVQGGVRLEDARSRLDLEPGSASPLAGDALVGRRFDYGYQNAFPSALVAYTFDADRQIKLSYSRRVNRLDPQQLTPYEYRESVLNVFQGNPTLKPEYIDAYELGFQQSFVRGSVQLASYYRTTPEAIRFFRTLDSAGLTHSSYANVARNETYGADVNVSLRLGWLSLFGGGSAFRNVTDAHNITPDISYRAIGWSVRGNATVKLTSHLEVQGSGSYAAPMVIEGGRVFSQTTSNIALKQRLSGDRASLTLRASDPFNIQTFGMSTNDGPFMQTINRRFGARALVLTYSYAFGRPPTLRSRSDDLAPPLPIGGS